MKKLAYALACPNCRIELGDHGKPSWVVPKWPDDLKPVRPGFQIDLPSPVKFPIMPVTCHACDSQIVGDAVVSQVLKVNPDTALIEKIRIYSGIQVRLNG